ncbi:MAG: hypothetical protein KAV87_09675 [Desulfobacteraceae bacterium]|nr:hypothetical protein [Desulfobacteraceae bacterium]
MEHAVVTLIEKTPNYDWEIIIKLFDDAYDDEITKDSLHLINGLTLLLTSLEEDDFGGNSILDLPILCKSQALCAAYRIGYDKGLKDK